jgi:hypothetical protein
VDWDGSKGKAGTERRKSLIFTIFADIFTGFMASMGGYAQFLDVQNQLTQVVDFHDRFR